MNGNPTKGGINNLRIETLVKELFIKLVIVISKTIHNFSAILLNIQKRVNLLFSVTTPGPVIHSISH